MMTDIMFELPSRDDVREVAITAECVTSGRAPLLVTERPRQKERSLSDPRFIGSFPRADVLLDPPLPEVAFVGRSNVGKSSLLNALVGRRIAKTSGTPGKTRALNVFPDRRLALLSRPPRVWICARGKAQRAAFRGLVKHALRRERLPWRGLAARHPPRAVHGRPGDAGTPSRKKNRKCSRRSRKEISFLQENAARERRELREELGLPEDQVTVTSAKTGAGITPT